MIELLFNDKNCAINSFIFHHAENKTNYKLYKFKISLDEKEIISFIENYSSCKIDDFILERNVIEKDKQKKSMGLLWELKVSFLDKLNTANSDNIHIFNNITRIYIKDGFLFIEGQAGIE